MIGATLNGWTIKPYVDKNGNIKNHIGQGGMATLYYAENRLGRSAAVKVLNPRYYQEAGVRQRFIQEALALVKVNHPNIVDAYDLIELADDDRGPGPLAVIMEYLEGKDLKTYLEENGPVTEGTLLDWMAQILPALHFIHQKNILHRDIKPSNIFLTDEGRIKIIDFGIVKITEPGLALTQTEQMIGTPMYMSPEQILTPRDIDARSDIYALGVTAVSLLTGKQPYETDAGSTPFSVQRKIVEESIIPPHHLSPRLRYLILKAVEKKRDDRFSSCMEFLDALNKIPTELIELCPNPICRQPLKTGIAFCSKCGAHKDAIYCVNGHLVNNGLARFCKLCGQAIRHNV